MTTWGIVSTLKAPVAAVLDFAAWHLELGASHLFLHFDDPDDPAPALLHGHPKIEVTVTNDQYWRHLKGYRPKRHQPRQSANATRTYLTNTTCDWLAHIDGDEFLLPDSTVASHLAALPDDCHTARLRPIEALASETASPSVYFKAFPLEIAHRHLQSARLYPTYGAHLNGGLLSHVAGKLFVRKGLSEVAFRIHNVLSQGRANPGQIELMPLPLAHFHAGSWQTWLRHYRYRLEKGAYRAELKPGQPGAMPLHDLLSTIEMRDGVAGLRHFYDEVCCDTPALRARLKEAGLLRHAEMDFPALRATHLPAFGR